MCIRAWLPPPRMCMCVHFMEPGHCLCTHDISILLYPCFWVILRIMNLMCRLLEHTVPSIFIGGSEKSGNEIQTSENHPKQKTQSELS